MSELLFILLGVAIGSALGWLACTLHWHTRLAESWSALRVAVRRRETHRMPVTPDRAVDVHDVTSAFGYGLVAEEALDLGESNGMSRGGASATERQHRESAE